MLEHAHTRRHKLPDTHSYCLSAHARRVHVDVCRFLCAIAHALWGVGRRMGCGMVCCFFCVCVLAQAGEGGGGGQNFVYFKYHKPLNVASSWDKNDKSSVSSLSVLLCRNISLAAVK